MDALAPGRSEPRAVVAEALTRLRGEAERRARRRFPSLDAGEVYQRAALKALERSEELRDPARVDGWFMRIVTTSALDIARERSRGPIASAEPPEPPPSAPTEPVCGCTLALLGGLPAPYADVLRRIDVDGASLADVAATLQLQKGNVAVRLHRARQALRRRLQEHCGVESIRQCFGCVCTHRGCCATA